MFLRSLILLSVCVTLAWAKVLPPVTPTNDPIACTYSMMAGQYACTLTLNNPGGLDDFTTIPGEHMAGMSNANVTFLFAMNQNSRNVPRIICETFPNLLDYILEYSNVEVVTDTAFASCRNLEFVILGYNNIRTIPDQTFANNERLEYVFLQHNLIRSISNGAFAGTNRISMLDLSYNELTAFNAIWLRPVAATLTHFYLNNNRIQLLPFYAFSEFTHLTNLAIGGNPFISVPDSTFYGLMSLTRLDLASSNLRSLSPIWFSSLFAIEELQFSNNHIRELPANIFNNLNNLTEINFSNNNLTFVNRAAFGNSIANLRHFFFANNRIEAFDQQIIDEVDLLYLYLEGNQCINRNFANVVNNRDQVRNELQSCITNFIGSISCTFFELRPGQYECLLSINNPVGRDFDNITGNHITGKTNDDVVMVEAIAENSRIIPAAICRTFPNTEVIWIELSRIEIINEDAFRDCPNLFRVNLNLNSIATIPDHTFRNNPNLVVFYAIVNDITQIGVNAFAGTSLRDINLEDNYLPSYNPAVFNNVAGTLEELNLAYNRITSIPPNAFNQLRALSYLTFSDNRLGTIPSNAFSGLISLTHFEFDNCDLSTLDPAWFTDLRAVYDVRLDGNNLQSLPAGIFAPLENLSVLTLNGNRLRNLNSNAFGRSLNSIRLLYANGNGIRSIDDEIITRGQNIATLQLSGNNCINQNFFNVQGNLDAVRSALGECFRMFVGFIECNYVRVRNDYICHMTIQNPRGTDFYYVPGTHMDNLSNSDVTILDAMRQETLIIPSTICRQFPNLVDLYIDESFVERIDEDAFEHCTNLEWLDLYGNAITSVPDFTFANSPRLANVYFLYNQISSIGPNAFTGTSLEMISLDQNSLEELDPRWLDPIRGTMKYLYLTANHIHEIPDHAFDGMRNLELLGLGSNQLSELPSRLFHDLVNLKYVWLHLNQFTEIEVEWFERTAALEFVSFYRNQIRDIPAHVFSNNPNLHEIDFGNNNLRLINSDSFAPNNSLAYLMVDFNQIQYIDPQFYQNTPNLNYLYLYNNFCINRNFYGVFTNRNATEIALRECFDNFNHPTLMTCVYINVEDYPYTCYLSANNLPGNDNTAVILGDHDEGRDDSQVTHVYMNYQVSRIIPSVICRQFVNLQELWADMSEVQNLNERSFAECRNLRQLVLEFNPLHVIPAGLFTNNANLVNIWLDVNHIHRIADGAFTGSAVASLGLGSNDLKEFNRGWFTGVQSTLTDIYMYENHFEELPRDAFNDLPRLRILDLGLNPGVILPPDIFLFLAEPANLLELYLDNNNMPALHSSWLTALINIERIHFHRNLFRWIPDGAFSTNTAVQQLFLGGSPIRFIGIEAFGNNPLSNLTFLNLMQSEIHAFDEAIFERATNLDVFYLYDNHCTAMNFYQVHLNRDDVRQQMQECFTNFVGSLSCAFMQVTGYPYMCEVRINNVAGRDDFTSIGGNHIGQNTNADVRLIEGLAQRTRNFPTLLCAVFNNVEEIYVTDSQIEVLTERTFAGCTQLDRLTLSYNNIQFLPSNLFLNNPNLGWLSLRSNEVWAIEDTAFAGTRLDVIELANNQLREFNSAAFRHVGNTLEALDVSNNRITELSSAFDTLTALLSLDLSRNHGLAVPENAFDNQQQMTRLVLNEIGLRNLHSAWFNHTRSLQYLSLIGNQIRNVPDFALQNLHQLRTLVLRGNNVGSLSLYAFGWNVRNVTDIILDHNRVNAFDIRIFDEMQQLNFLYMNGNICANQNFLNVVNNRPAVRQAMWTCFDNYGIDEPDQ